MRQTIMCLSLLFSENWRLGIFVFSDQGMFKIVKDDFVTFEDGLKCRGDINAAIRKHQNLKKSVEGVVIKSVGSSYFVRTSEGASVECKLKGIFRIRGLKATNPVAVGDFVSFDVEKNEGSIITKIHERKNYIIRKSTKLSKSVHIIASNIDQALLLVTLAFPRTSTGFIDRFLVTAEAYKIPVIIVFNKCDLSDSDMDAQIADITGMYEKIGYPCMRVSALKGTNIAALKKVMKGKTSLIAGHSGVGKSAIVNAVEPGLKLRTGDLSMNNLKGTHTTTFAEMYPLQFGGYIIDTPGIKEFGLVDFYKEDLCHYFPELFALLPQCKYHNCTHTDEPDCAVQAAAERGDIHPLRYQNYLNIYYGRELDEQDW
jgi:ribosome biogenesis GTPase